MVEEQTGTYRWQFVYLGANVDAFAEAGQLGFARHATANYAASARGVKGMYAGVSASVTSYRSGVTAEVAFSDTERQAMTGA